MRGQLPTSIRFSAELGLLNNRCTTKGSCPASWLWATVGVCAIWLGFPAVVYSFPPLVLLWPIALWRLGAMSAGYGAAFRFGLVVSCAGSLAALYWLAIPVAQVGGLPWPGAVACAVLIALVLATQGGLFAAAAYGARFCSPVRQAVILALVWYFLELGYAVVAGFPWLPIAGALAQWPLLVQPAAIFGAYLTGALWLCGLLLIMLRRPMAGIWLSVALLAYSSWRICVDPEDVWPTGSDSIAALMVEGNVDQSQKWTLPFQERSLNDYLRLTEEGLLNAADKFKGEKPLIIWPETALPFFYEINRPLAYRLGEAVARFGSPLLFGAPGMEKSPDGDELIYNRAFLLGGDGQRIGHYDKEHLVPFGEYLPSWLKLDFLEALLQGVGVYEEGAGAAPLRYGRVALGLLICYEGIFPWLAQDRVDSGANILVDISNDGWFGRSPAARQHLFLTALRCVEQGRYMFRATNTGISAVIDTRGRVVVRGPQFAAGSVACRGRLLGGRTAYHRLARLWPWICGVILASIWVTGRKRHVPTE